MRTKEFLKKYKACKGGAKWAISISDDMVIVWDTMVREKRHEFLLWTAIRQDVFPINTVRLLLCRFIRETPLMHGGTIWDLLTEQHSRAVVEVAERYARGQATKDELDDAHRRAYCSAGVIDPREACSNESFVVNNTIRTAKYAAATAAHVASDLDEGVCGDIGYYNSIGSITAVFSAACGNFNEPEDIDYAAVYHATNTARAAQVQMIAELGNPFKRE